MAAPAQAKPETARTAHVRRVDRPAPIGNVVDYLFEHSAAPGLAEGAAHRLDGGDVSYRALHARVCRAGSALKRLGLAPGDRVMLSLLDGPDFVAVFLGGIKMGAVTLPINTMLKPKDYLYYLNDSEAKAVVIDASLVPAIDAIKGELRTVRHILVAGARVPGYELFDDALAAASPELETLPRDPDDMAFWLYSSGSTGDPKGVVHTHAHIYWATELFGLAMLRIAAGDVIVCPPKMFFAYGLGNQVYFPIRAGATVVVNQGPITPKRVWELWLKHRPTIVMSVPTLFAAQAQIAEQELGRERVAKACERLRFCICGGEILPPALYQRWKDLTGTEILDAIGTTEMTHMFTFNRPGEAVPGSCGKIVDGYRYEVLDNARAPVARGEIGNLHVFGPTAASRYWNKPAKTEEVMGRGGVLTGDKVFEDERGNIFLVGRSDDMLRVGAIWVSPAEVEGALATHPAVMECAVVGHPDDNQMIKPKAFVVLRDPARAGETLAAEIAEHVRARLAHIKCPRWIEFVGELPKTATGKIQRFRLRGVKRAKAGARAAEPGGTKSQRRREDILRKALELFDRQGYANTSLDDIARAVGIAREGIYYYFKNRAEILLHIIEPRSLALIEGLRKIVAAAHGGGYAGKLHDAVRNHLEQFDLHCLEMTVSLRDGHLEDARAVRASMARIWKEYETLWTRLIAEGQRAGEFKAMGDPKMLAFGILGMCNWLARWYDPKKGVPIAELVESYSQLVGRGLVAER